MQTINIIRAVANKLSDKKAENIKIFSVKGLSSLCDYIIIASSSNSTHVKSLTDEMQNLLKENNLTPKNIEKDDNFTWVVLDCQEIIINIFHSKTREFYNLEALWSDATEISLS